MKVTEKLSNLEAETLLRVGKIGLIRIASSKK
jgi:hypothetical protein